MLELKRVSKYFSGIKAVNNCSFVVEGGKITLLVGPNGSGKTTIFNLINGLLNVDAGSIFYCKFDITNLPPEKISNLGIARVFQKTQLFDNLTVKENLLLAANSDDSKFWKSFCLIEKNNFKQKIDKIKQILNLVDMKFLLDTCVKELSFGQKRLIEIVRSILNTNKFLMLDEPVAGVNPKLRKKIFNLLLRLKKQGTTIFLIEHDMNFALNIADRVIILDNGKVVRECTPNYIKNNKKELNFYFGY